jgi:two-component sensor histidine kinase
MGADLVGWRMRILGGGRFERAGWLRAAFVAIVCTALGYFARVLIDVVISGQVPFVTFYPAVMAASLLAGVRSGVICVVISTPLAVMAFGGNYPVATTVIWLVLSSVVAAGCGLAYELRARLRIERDELARTKQKLELVVREQTHRAKNTFAILNALAQQSAKGVTNVEEYRDRLTERVRALSSAYNLMSTGDADAPVLLDSLVNLSLAPFSETFGARLKIVGGPAISLAPSAAIPLVLCLHELATNAVKYGALSSPAGEVTCDWAEAESGLCKLRWTETGGPSVDKPRTAGFGTRMIGAALNGVPGGSAVMKFEPQGVLCELAFAPA